MVALTFHGGVDEIGGNKVLLETDDGAVLLDFGRRMGMTGEYYSEFLQVRSRNALRDLLRLGVLPEIDGVYDASFLDVSTMMEERATRARGKSGALGYPTILKARLGFRMNGGRCDARLLKGSTSGLSFMPSSSTI